MKNEINLIEVHCGPVANTTAASSTAERSLRSAQIVSVGTFIISMWCVPIRAATPTIAPSNTNRVSALMQSQACRIVMAPHVGNEKLDRQIQQTQHSVQTAADPLPQLERLGWLFVAKARTSHDAGFYKLAEQCAAALTLANPKSSEALLLHGHVLQSFHRFKEAESLARQLVTQREFAADHGLLGDALIDQGKVREAISAYQRMVDLRPDLQSYSRVAYVRWLRGDLTGATDVALRAARMGNVQDAESSAWACSRLGNYQFQAGRSAEARNAIGAALELMSDFPPALLLRGRMLLAAGNADKACEPLRIAAQKSPLPEYQWAFAEALQAAGRATEAAAVENEIKRTGEATDPRTFALFLATRREQPELAVRLAERELEQRADVFTHDAVAWALFAAGRADDAWSHVEKSLAEGTQDARLFSHAGIIATQLGRTDDGRKFLLKAEALKQLLLPSEQAQLAADLATLKISATARAAAN